MQNYPFLFPNCYTPFSGFLSHPIVPPPPFQPPFKQVYEDLRQKYDELANSHTKLLERYRQLEESITSKKGPKRSLPTGRVKSYHCPYDECRRRYASEMALSLHLRQKHKTGNKKQMDKAAMIIMKCQMAGVEPPQLKIKLPPNYIKDNHIRLMLMDSDQSQEKQSFFKGQDSCL